MRDLSDVTAVILAGGLGTRLRSVVVDRPKVLADVCGRPFIAYLLDQLVTAKIKEVVLCTGYLGEQVQAALGDNYGPLRLLYSQEPASLDTAGALRLALPLLKSNPVLVLNGDSFFETDLRIFRNWHGARGAEATLLLTYRSNTKRYGRVQINGDGLVLSFNEKDDRNCPGWINGGIYLINRPLLETIPEGMAVSLERDVFPSWIGRKLYGYCSQGLFLDIGTPESYAATEQFFHLGTQI